MKRIPYLLCMFMSITYAQNMDSVWNVWGNKSLPDTTRVKALTMFTRNLYRDSAPERTLSLTDSVIQFGHQYHHPWSESMGYLIRGLYMNRMGEYKQALVNFDKSAVIAREIKDTSVLTSLYNNMANTYKGMGDLDSALVCYNYCIALSKLMLDTNGVAMGYLNMAEVYQRKGDAPAALSYLQQSLKIYEITGDEASASMTCMNLSSLYQENNDTTKSLYYGQKALFMHKKLGITNLLPYDYMSLGSLYKMKNRPDIANKYFNEVVKITQQTGEKEVLGHAYMALAAIYIDMGDPERALKMLEEVFKVNLVLGNLPMMSQAHILKGKIYLKQKKYSAATGECLKSYQFSLEMKSLDDREQSCECLATAYDHLGDYKNSSRFYKEFIAIKDSINTDAKIKEFTELRLKYDFDKEQLADSIDYMSQQHIKDVQIEKNKSNIRLETIGLSFAGLGIILMITLAVVIYKGKKRSDELLLNILPYEIAQELKKKGYADAKQFEQVSVLFTDFKGFTGIAEKLSPTRVVEEINECFKEFDRIMGKYGIEKIKTIGDAYMAAAGLPVVNKNNAPIMINAALEIRDYMNNRPSFYAEGDTKNPLRFDIRIGIHTGPVVAGIVGTKKFQYDIWGDTVNFASRMESSGEPGKVNISSHTRELVINQFAFEYRGEIEAKGKGMLKMFFVERLSGSIKK